MTNHLSPVGPARDPAGTQPSLLNQINGSCAWFDISQYEDVDTFGCRKILGGVTYRGSVARGIALGFVESPCGKLNTWTSRALIGTSKDGAVTHLRRRPEDRLLLGAPTHLTFCRRKRFG